MSGAGSPTTVPRVSGHDESEGCGAQTPAAAVSSGACALWSHVAARGVKWPCMHDAPRRHLPPGAGDLIGINTAIYSPSGANSGVGFAIPVDTVKESVVEIIANGRVVRPVLGIAFAPDTSTSQLGVNGILVLSVKDGGPASKVCPPLQCRSGCL